MLTFLLSVADESNHDKIIYIYDNYHDDMIRLARCRLKKCGCANWEIDAEDVVQSSFLKILKYIDAVNFNVGEKEIKAYVLSIVANEINNLLSENVFLKDIDDYEEKLLDEDFFEKLLTEERYTRIVDKIKLLDEKYSTTLLYHYCGNIKVKEIAKLLEISEKTVYIRLQKGKQILLEMLEGDDEDE